MYYPCRERCMNLFRTFIYLQFTKATIYISMIACNYAASLMLLNTSDVSFPMVSRWSPPHHQLDRGEQCALGLGNSFGPSTWSSLDFLPL